MVNLTIGGGNFRGVCYLGSLEYLYQNHLIEKIDNFYGTSVGSIIGILYIIKYVPLEIFNIIIELDLNSYWDFNIDHINKNYSLISDNIFNKLKDIFSQKENPDITIKEFVDKYKININIFAINLKTRKTVNFNIHDHPDIPVLKAIQASSSIPIIFPPTIINNEYYLDGCIKNIDGVNSQFIKNDKNIHFVIKSNNENLKINTVMDYLYEIISCVAQNDDIIDTEYTINITTLNEYKKKIDFKINDSDKVQLFYYGIKIAKDKLNDNIADIKMKINEMNE
tara:strand:- start:1978 stop:2820 length:843 start_codon:yes stop_codon:yes gene_type:complete